MNLIPKMACHGLCDLFYLMTDRRRLTRVHASCLTCYRRIFHYKRHGWKNLEQFKHFQVVADSVYPDGILLPEQCRVYWLAIHKHGILDHSLRVAVCKALMILADKFKVHGKEGPQKIKRDITIADSISPEGVILPRSFTSYFIFIPTPENATRSLRLKIMKRFLTVAEIIAQI